jgi:hypothetical protein
MARGVDDSGIESMASAYSIRNHWINLTPYPRSDTMTLLILSLIILTLTYSNTLVTLLIIPLITYSFYLLNIKNTLAPASIVYANKGVRLT